MKSVNLRGERLKTERGRKRENKTARTKES